MSASSRSTATVYDRVLTFLFHTGPLTLLVTTLFNIGVDLIPGKDDIYYAASLITECAAIVVVLSLAYHVIQPCPRCERLRDQGADAAQRHLPVLRLYHHIPAIIAYAVLFLIFGVISTSMLLSLLPAIGRAAFLPEKLAYYTTFLLFAVVARVLALHKAYGPWCPLIKCHNKPSKPASNAA